MVVVVKWRHHANRLLLIIIHQTFWLARDWSKRVTYIPRIFPAYSPAKTGEYPRIFSSFQNCSRCEKDLKDNKGNSLHSGQKYARICVLGHHLFFVVHSFPRASLSENCSLLGTENVRGQISEHNFAPNGDYCLYIPQFSKLGALWKRFEG